MRVFLDTNVLAYRYDEDAGPKHRRAKELVLDFSAERVLSTQVLLELHNFLTRKLRFTRSEAKGVLERIWLETVPATKELVLKAAETADAHQLSMFDSLIIEAAAAAGCAEIWSEDLNAGQVISGVRVVNPFAV